MQPENWRCGIELEITAVPYKMISNPGQTKGDQHMQMWG